MVAARPVGEPERAARARGRVKPRLAPPTPARSDVKGLEAVAVEMGHPFIPWQSTAGRYLEALDRDGGHLYREVAVIVARQNGKTELLRPLIVKRLRAKRRIMHTAQNRELPREVFYDVAEFMWEHHRDLFPERNGRPTKPRYANGQEEIRLNNGAHYRIAAPTRGGARGPSNDDVIVDELREFDTWEFIGAAKPTMTARPDPQIIYLSNAGEADSVVLNALRARAGEDPALAYLEWSAAPERRIDDRRGWAEANPGLGYLPGIMETLETEYRSNQLADTLALFEVEHLCRWVNSTEPEVVGQAAWGRCHRELEPPGRVFVGISVDPSGSRVSAVAAWQQTDGRIALTLVADIMGDPVDIKALGPDLRRKVAEVRGTEVGFDPWTDGELAAHFPRAKAVNGRDFATASMSFATATDAGKLAWEEADEVGEDLRWMTRKQTQSDAWMAVKAKDGRPITAGLAAIRAAFLATNPRGNREARIF